MMRFKRGMTLAETLLVFIIMGIIASLTIISVKPWEKAYRPIYSRIYNALATTIYNDMIDTGKFPDTSYDFYKSLVKYMNNTSTKPTDNLNTSATLTKVTSLDLGAKPTFAPTDYDNAIHLSNGTFIWIGGNKDNQTCATKVGSSNVNYTCPFEYTLWKKDRDGNYVLDGSGNKINSGSLKFYLVYADLNGAKKPNTPVYSSNPRPDIVAFAVTDKFIVIPLGHPQYDKQYLEAHYVKPSENEEDEDVVSDPMSYRVAQIRAFGTGTPGESACTSADSTDCETVASVAEPNSIDVTELQTVLDWKYTNSAKTQASSPFFIDWDKITIRGQKLEVNATTGETTTVETTDLYIDESCKIENSATGSDEPICSVKIYDYH